MVTTPYRCTVCGNECTNPRTVVAPDPEYTGCTVYDLWCTDCASKYATKCDDCGEIVANTAVYVMYMHDDTRKKLCGVCRTNYYCENGAWVPWD